MKGCAEDSVKIRIGFVLVFVLVFVVIESSPIEAKSYLNWIESNRVEKWNRNPTIQYETVRDDTTRYDAVRHDMVRYGVLC